MAFKKIPLTIDTMIRNPVPVEGINQEDNIELNIVVTENKTPKDLSSQTIKVYVRRIDGTLVEQTDQITPTNARKGEVTVKLKNSAFNKEGYALFQLDVSDSIGRITSSYATFKIGKGLISGEAIANTNEVNALKQIEEYVKKAGLKLIEFNKAIETLRETIGIVGEGGLTTEAKSIKPAINELNKKTTENLLNIEKNGILHENLKNDLQEVIEFKFEKMEAYEEEKDCYFDKTGKKFMFSNYGVKKYNVREYTKYKANAYSKFQAAPITFWHDEEFLGYVGELNPGGSEEIQNQTLIITTPKRCNKIFIQSIIILGEFLEEHYLEKEDLKLKTDVLKKKKWGAIGDSLTDVNTLKKQTETKNYVDFVSENLGLQATNLGVGGTGYWNGKDRNMNFSKRCERIETGYDVITIFGSFNDNFITTNYTLGSVADKTEETLFGCMNKTLENIYKVNPDVIIGIILPTPWGGWNLRNPSRLEKCKEYINALVEFANYNSLPILDLFHGSNLRPWESTFNTKYFLNADSVHPLSEAHKKFIAPKIENFIKEICYK